MDSKGLSKLIDRDFPDFTPINDNTIEVAKNESLRYRGSVRIATGKFWTNEQYEKNRERVLSSQLP